MIKQFVILFTCALALSFSATVFAEESDKQVETEKISVQAASAKEDKAIASAIDSFYGALNILFTGNGQPMRDAWSHADDVTYMGPDGLYLIGWNNVGKMWNSVAALKLGGRVSPQRIHTIVGVDMAMVNCIEVGENNVNGKAEKVSIRSSTLLYKRGGSWKVVAHQTDLLGYLK